MRMVPDLQLGELYGGDADGPNITQVVVPALPLHRRHLPGR